MMLNRCIRRNLLPQPVVERNLQSALTLAQEFLSSIKTTLEIIGSTRHSTGVGMTDALSPHFSVVGTSNAVLYALDILSEAGSLEPSCFLRTMSLIRTGLDVLNHQTTLYPISDNQKRTIEKRFEHLTFLLHEKQHSKRAWAVTSVVHHFADVDGGDSHMRNEIVSWRASRLLDALGFDVRDDDIIVVDDEEHKS